MRRCCVGGFKRRVWWLFAGFCGFFAACQTPSRDEAALRVRFHLENNHAATRGAVQPWRMPVSGVAVTVNALPALMEDDIINVELVEVELGRCLLFEFNRPGARALLALTAANPGQRLLLLIEGAPVGLRVIEGPEASGQWLTFTELSDPELETLVLRLKRSFGDD